MTQLEARHEIFLIYSFEDVLDELDILRGRGHLGGLITVTLRRYHDKTVAERSHGHIK